MLRGGVLLQIFELCLRFGGNRRTGAFAKLRASGSVIASSKRTTASNGRYRASLPTRGRAVFARRGTLEIVYQNKNAPPVAKLRPERGPPHSRDNYLVTAAGAGSPTRFATLNVSCCFFLSAS